MTVTLGFSLMFTTIDFNTLKKLNSMPFGFLLIATVVMNVLLKRSLRGNCLASLIKYPL